MAPVTYKLDVRTLQEDCRRQVLLAALAQTDEVRLVHEALEQLYRTQLVTMELADQLSSAFEGDRCRLSDRSEVLGG